MAIDNRDDRDEDSANFEDEDIFVPKGKLIRFMNDTGVLVDYDDHGYLALILREDHRRLWHLGFDSGVYM